MNRTRRRHGRQPSTPADTLVSSTVTDSNGEYEFTGLNPGDYIVCEVILTKNQTG